MLTEDQKQSLCEVMVQGMEESAVHEIMVEHLWEWLSDFDDSTLEKMYRERVGTYE